LVGEAEADIIGRVIDPSNPTLTRAAAEWILALGYSEADQARMTELTAKSNQGVLTPAEHRKLEGYVFVGDPLSILKSKARLSLRKHSPAA
jgi:hypothetical protein